MVGNRSQPTILATAGVLVRVTQWHRVNKYRTKAVSAVIQGREDRRCRAENDRSSIQAFGSLQCFHPAGQVAQVGLYTVYLLEKDTPRTDVVGVEVRGHGVHGRRLVGHGINPLCRQKAEA